MFIVYLLILISMNEYSYYEVTIEIIKDVNVHLLYINVIRIYLT